jgi:hypothetical protein
MTSAAEPTPAPVPGAAGPADVYLDAGGNVAVLTLGPSDQAQRDRVNQLFARSAECI